MVDHTTPPTRHAIPLFVRNFCHLQPMVRAMTIYNIIYIYIYLFCHVLPYVPNPTGERTCTQVLYVKPLVNLSISNIRRIPFFLAVWGLLIRFCIPKGKFMVVFVVSAFLELFLLCMMDSYESERCGRADGDGVPVPRQLK